MSDITGIRFDWRAVDDLPFARIEISTAAIFSTARILTDGRLIVLSPKLMQHEFLRFLTLLRFPRQNKPDLTSIAAAGFYNDGNADAIICFMCGLTIYGIQRNDNPFHLHIEKSRSCAFFLRNPESNFRCFKGTDSENDCLQRFDNGELVTLEQLNHITGNAVEIVGENEADRQHNESIGTSDASDPSVEGEYVQVGNEPPSLPYPGRVNEELSFGPPNEHHREHVPGNYNIESDLNVSLTDDLRPRDVDTYVIQAMNGQEVSSERHTNHQSGVGFQPESGSSDTVEVSANILPSVRDGENEVHHRVEREYIIPNQNRTYNNTSDFHIRLSAMLPDILRQLLQPSNANNSYVSRLQSFREWPKGHIVNAKDLAAAGFSYTGMRDCVRCFQCALELSQWQRGDDPWLEHATKTSACIYVEQSLGQDFMMAVRENNEVVIEKYKACHEEVPLRNDSGTGEAMCKVCQANVICYVFIPCGHMACRTCADVVKVCQRCQQDIKQRTSVQF